MYHKYITFDNLFIFTIVALPTIALIIKYLSNNMLFNAKHKKLFRYLDNLNPDKESNYTFKSKKNINNGFIVKYKVLNEIADIDYIIKNESRIKSFLRLDNSYKILASIDYETLTIKYQQLKL